MEEGVQNLLAQIGSCVLWIPSITNVLPLLGGDNKGGYGVVHKVQIKRFNCIPNTIELAGKTSNMDDKWEVHKERLVEALACMCEHPSVIKFLAIHVETMEVYTLECIPPQILRMIFTIFLDIMLEYNLGKRLEKKLFHFIL
jgi:hypothetical protein